MALFPNDKYPDYGYRSWQEENVVRNDPRAPKVMVKDMWGRTRFRAQLRYSLRTDDVLTVMGFWKINRVIRFDFIDFDYDIYILDQFRRTDTKAVIDTTHGTATYEFYAKGVRNVTVYLAGVAQLASKYTIAEGVGNDGMARLTWTAGNIPAAGTQIRVSYSGMRLFACKFIVSPTKESISYGRQAMTFEVAEDI